MIERELAEFGRRMGMPDFALNEAGLAALDVNRLGRLYLERAESGTPSHGEPELLIYVAVPVPAHDVDAPRRVLELCSYTHAPTLPLQGGWHKDQILLLTRLPESRVTAAELENAVRFLAAALPGAIA